MPPAAIHPYPMKAGHSEFPAVSGQDMLARQPFAFPCAAVCEPCPGTDAAGNWVGVFGHGGTWGTSEEATGTQGLDRPRNVSVASQRGAVSVKGQKQELLNRDVCRAKSCRCQKPLLRVPPAEPLSSAESHGKDARRRQ